MAATSYLPKSAVAEVRTFVKYVSVEGSPDIEGLETELNTEFGESAGAIQCTADTTGGGTNALVIVNDNTVFSLPLNSSVTWFRGKWTQATTAELTAGYVVYT